MKLMNIKSLLGGILIGAVTIPTVIMGGSFVSSLVAGNTPAEAVTILAEQIDILIGRIEIVEIKQVEQEQTISELQDEISTMATIPETGISPTEDELKEHADEILKLIVPISPETELPSAFELLPEYNSILRDRGKLIEEHLTE